MLQAIAKKRLLYGGIVFIWIIRPVLEITIGLMSTDIIKGTCVPWGVYSSYAADKIMGFSILFFTYLLPLIAMLFCYFRIVSTIKHKVTSAL